MGAYKGESEEKQKKTLNDYLEKILPSYLKVMQKRLIANGGSHKYFVGESVTLADFNNAHIAYTYFLNESNKLHKEQSEILHQD